MIFSNQYLGTWCAYHDLCMIPSRLSQWTELEVYACVCIVYVYIFISIPMHVKNQKFILISHWKKRGMTESYFLKDYFVQCVHSRL